MRTKLNKALLVVGLAVLMCGVTMQASATSLSFTQYSAFDIRTVLSNDVAGSKNNDVKHYQNIAAATILTAGFGDGTSNYFNTLAWGRNNNLTATQLGLTTDPFINGTTGDPNTAYSGLRVLGQTGTVSTGASVGLWGAPVTITVLNHQNNPIYDTYHTLTSANIYSELHIGLTYMDPNTIPMTFQETLNATPCDPSGPPGTACPDWFGFNVAGSNVGNGFQGLTFMSGTQKFEAEFSLIPAINYQRPTTFTNPYVYCDPTTGDCKIWTQENIVSQMAVQMAIREVAVPEPATLTLFGLGLLGLAGTRRKFKK